MFRNPGSMVPGFKKSRDEIRQGILNPAPSSRLEPLPTNVSGGRNQIDIRMTNIEHGISNHEVRSRKSLFLPWTFYIRYSAVRLSTSTQIA